MDLAANSIIVLNLGFEGYKRIMDKNLTVARLISRALEHSGYFICLSKIHHPKALTESSSSAEQSSILPAVADAANTVLHGKKTTVDDAEYYCEGLPVVSFMFTDEIKKKYPGVKQAWIQMQLRSIGWIVPKYVRIFLGQLWTKC